MTAAPPAAPQRDALLPTGTLLTIQYGLGGEQEMQLRTIFREQMEQAVALVSPLVRDGLPKGDAAEVQQKLRAIWADLDRLMTELLDEEKYAAHEENEALRHQLTEGVLQQAARR